LVETVKMALNFVLLFGSHRISLPITECKTTAASRYQKLLKDIIVFTHCHIP
jgi:hypothetical protein